MVLVVMYLYYNDFIFVQNQNISFQDVTSQSQQLDADRNSEDVSFSASATQSGNNYIVAFTVKNTGPIPAQLIRIWGIDSENEYTSQELSIVLQPGAQSSETVIFDLGGSMSDIVMWVVTARGNLISTSAKVT